MESVVVDLTLSEDEPGWVLVEHPRAPQRVRRAAVLRPRAAPSDAEGFVLVEPQRRRREPSTAPFIDLTAEADDEEVPHTTQPARKRPRREQQQQQQQPPPPPPQEQQERQPPPHPPPQPRELAGSAMCGVCFEELDAAWLLPFQACQPGHQFCQPCLREYIACKAKERAWPIPCPDPTCRQPISLDECRLVLSAVEGEALGCAAAEAAIPGAERLFCPNPQCSQLLVVERPESDGAAAAGGGQEQQQEQQQGRPFDCPYCGKAVCAACGVLWHRDLTCTEYQALPQDMRGEGDQALMALAASRRWKKCPNCRNMVERSTGCNAMRCRCGAAFCYSCGGGWGSCNCRGNAGHYPLPPVHGAAGGGVAAAAGLLGALGGVLGGILEGALLGAPMAPAAAMAANAALRQQEQQQQAARAEARRLQAQLRAQGRQQVRPAELQWRQQQAQQQRVEQHMRELHRGAGALDRLLVRQRHEQREQQQQQVVDGRARRRRSSGE